MDFHVSIIIVNYNTTQLTIECIDSIKQYTSDLKIEIIVIDNGSGEKNKNIFSNKFPDITFIENSKNLGFSVAVNQGVKISTGKYICLLNSDAKLVSNAFYYLWEFMQNKPSAGAVTPRLIYPNGKIQSVAQRFPSIYIKLFEILRLQKLLGKKISGNILLGSYFDYNKSIEVDWIWGTCFFFRRNILTDMPHNELNCEYFMYCEDMQWCLDMKRKNWEVWFLHTVEIVHHQGASSGSKNDFISAGMEKFFNKNYNLLYRYFLKIFYRNV